MLFPLRPCAIRTLLTDLSHLPGFNTERSRASGGILYLQTRLRNVVQQFWTG